MLDSFTISEQSILCSPPLPGRAGTAHRRRTAARAAQAQGKEQDNARPDQGPAPRHVDGAGCARRTIEFFTHKLGLRRVKKTVNFDAPDVYHLYYGDEIGTPGSVMTYFPFPNIGKGRHGVGEVGTTVFSVPEGTLGFWEKRLADAGRRRAVKRGDSFGEKRLAFAGPDGDGFALVEAKDDSRAPWTQGGVPADEAIRGFHSARCG